MPALQVAWQAVKRLPAPLLAATAAGWTVLALRESSASLSTFCVSGEAISRGAFSGSTVASTLLPDLALMLLAMMPPLLASPLQHIWRRSLTRRRGRAIALFIVGYLGIWLAVGMLLVAASRVLTATAWPGIALGALIAMAWQATPLKQASLNLCHRRPALEAFGLRAETDALLYGVTHGIWCAGACWALMLLPLLVGGPLHWALMPMVMLIAIIERARAPQPVRWNAAWPQLPDGREVRALNYRAACRNPPPAVLETAPGS
jgi:predicted metal-binding membrane protein